MEDKEDLRLEEVSLMVSTSDAYPEFADWLWLTLLSKSVLSSAVVSCKSVSLDKRMALSACC
jgi:hypothetical protein